ncbi:4'-phosphopantetheinyl transferase family protein [Streptomyces sp. NPDC127092]|uniref:4'-phosphopantetheinyl transferase family protein n=1 Tax=Streptomyces sp. NPDC127092 TaxID=3347135 RepID=UPI0036626F0C
MRADAWLLELDEKRDERRGETRDEGRGPTRGEPRGATPGLADADTPPLGTTVLAPTEPDTSVFDRTELDPIEVDPSVLDARERERAAAFLRPADRTLYTVAHVALRTVLGRLLGERPEDLRFTREPCPCCGEPHGRPALAVSVPEPPLHFSLSHTRGRVLIATAPVPVGADVELRPEPEAVKDLVSVLHPSERAEIEAGIEAATGAGAGSFVADREAQVRRAAAFGRIWARKEAYLKGLGTGLGRAPHLDDLSTGAAPPAGWSLYDLPGGPSHHAAIALRAPHTTTEPPRLHHLT